MPWAWGRAGLRDPAYNTGNRQEVDPEGHSSGTLHGRGLESYSGSRLSESLGQIQVTEKKHNSSGDCATKNVIQCPWHEPCDRRGKHTLLLLPYWFMLTGRNGRVGASYEHMNREVLSPSTISIQMGSP